MHTNFRKFWGRPFADRDVMQSMGQGWLALQLSNSAFVVGLVAAAGSLPILLFSLYAGVMVDRSDKLRLVRSHSRSFSSRRSRSGISRTAMNIAGSSAWPCLPAL
jgi:hypothetical protein